MSPTIDLCSGDLACRISPELGGAILSLRQGGLDILRSVDRAADVLETAAFPLVPFANRIDHGRLTFAGRDVQLLADPAAPPHAHHGEAWRRPWRVEDLAPDEATLVFQGGDDAAYGWPWRYTARQNVRLAPGMFSLELAVTNLDPDQVMPLGLGWHPYFPRGASATLCTTASQMWRNDGTGLAYESEPSSLFAGSPVALESIEGLDNFFVCEAPELTLQLDHAKLTLAGQGAGFHLFTPPGQSWFCLEPVTHVPNAFGRGAFADRDHLPPGMTMRQRSTIHIATLETHRGLA